MISAIAKMAVKRREQTSKPEADHGVILIGILLAFMAYSFDRGK
jgi:hypothetical protein